MAPASKAEKKAAVDAAAWMFNVVTSVGIIMVNKALMATYGFSFGKLSLLKFLVVLDSSNSCSITCISPQIAKLSMIPVSCFLEIVFDKVRYSRGTKLSIGLVLIGVGVCTVTDVSVNAKGFIAAFIAVWSTSLQQYYVHYLQKKYSLSSFNLLGHTAPVQATSLLIVGPFLDYWLTGKRIDAFNYTLPSVFFVFLSCTIAIGTNLSQFICIGRFTAVSFQVLGHMKTILVLILGFIFFGKEGLNLHVVFGMIIAVLGMIWYGNASSKPGGKERRSLSLPKQQKHGSGSTELDAKV
ncbi:hypothetical protein Cgig2_024842 [Carnegiea gigantea]|uniref:Sugar phosphate transporter domain-containing protein n=1 Tax=Carnegiea gigantea TaxID=171969 RepID=A0A9Q1QIA4_9CARY|nr:hypothetical protein Cgig2_024842 [Carnegiea gigantea]